MARVLDAAVAVGIGFGSGGIRRKVGDEEGTGWTELGRIASRLGLAPKRRGAGHKKEWPKSIIGRKKTFHILYQGFEFNNQGFKYIQSKFEDEPD
jgi:hypothetical protein